MKTYQNNGDGKGTKSNAIFYLAYFMVGVAVASSIFYFKISGDQLSANTAGLLSPMREHVADDDVLVNFMPLRNYLIDTYENNPGVSIYFEFLNTGSNISISKDAEFFPASLLKVPLAMAVIKKIEQGKWKWGNELVVLENDKDDRFGELHKEEVGSKHTIESLIRKSLIDSDNTAYTILLRNMEAEEIESVYEHLGLDDFFAKDGKISARRYAVVLRSLYHAAYLSKLNSEKVLSWLSETPFPEYLEQGLAEGTKFSHKIGVSGEESVYMDAGIVYLPERPYVVIVMTHGIEDKDARNIMKDISEKTYDYIISYESNN